VSEAGQGILLSIEQIQKLVSRCPYQAWLGLKVIESDREHTVLELPWREELMSSPEQRSTHGGVLAALIDAGGCYAIAASLGYTVPTVDMHVDYHRVAKPGPLVAHGRPIKIGRLVAVAEARITDGDNRLIASGKVVYRNKRNSA
jgi:uncharacterized protein (TIGR00369 family)